MVTLREVLRSPRLGLSLLTGEHALDREIRWAHVSELDDPTPWLEGGELLLTTGLNAQWGYDGALAYCRRLANAGVSALGVSTGPNVAHESVPDDLVRAARDADLALVDIPNLTPLQSVVRAVADAINSELNQPLRSTVEIQRQLSEAAASGNGILGVFARLRESAGLDCVAYDTRLRPLTPEGEPPGPLTAELRQQIRKRILGEARGSMSVQLGGASMVVLPLGMEGTVRGVLVVRHRDGLSAHQRAIMKMSVPILSLLLDLRHAADAPQRRAQQAVIEALLGGKESPERITGILQLASISASTVQVVRARTRSGPQRRGFVAGLAELAGDVLVRNEDDRMTAILCDPKPGVPELLRELVDECNVLEVGLGKEVDPHSAELSFREATRAGEIAQSRGVPFVALPDYHTHTALMLLGNAAEQSAFADAILHPIDAHDRANSRQALLPALLAFFDAIGSLEAAAAALGIHRHTMRARLAKVSEISGHDLTSASDYLELWLAVEFRRLHPARDTQGS